MIGITGRAYSGKSTAAKYLETLGYKRLAFANAVKRFAVEHFGVTEEEAFVTKPPHVRSILQGIGNGLREEFGSDVWVSRLDKEVERLRSRNPDVKIVIDDLRYRNEAAYVRYMGGTIIRLVCFGSPFELEGDQRNHPSEAQVDTIRVDHEIVVPFGNIDLIHRSLNSLGLV